MRFDSYGYEIFPGDRGYATADEHRIMSARRAYPEPIDLPGEWCWACGRGWHDIPYRWGGPWYLQDAHLSSGSGVMRRVHDRRAVVLLCPWCHLAHRHTSCDVRICNVTHPALTDANCLWIKQQMDPDYYDVVAIAEWWHRTMPEPVPLDAWYENQYVERRGVRCSGQVRRSDN